MFWMYNNGSAQSSLSGLYYWDHGANFGRLNSLTALGIPANLPANAAFAWDSIFYIPTNENVLSRIGITYDPTSGLPISAFKWADYVINAPASQATNMQFGDIAISPISSQLYGSTSTGQFFRIDLSNLNAPGGLPFTLLLQSAQQPTVQTGACACGLGICMCVTASSLCLLLDLPKMYFVLTVRLQSKPRKPYTSVRRDLHHVVRRQLREWPGKLGETCTFSHDGNYDDTLIIMPPSHTLSVFYTSSLYVLCLQWYTQDLTTGT